MSQQDLMPVKLVRDVMYQCLYSLIIHDHHTCMSADATHYVNQQFLQASAEMFPCYAFSVAIYIVSLIVCRLIHC